MWKNTGRSSRFVAVLLLFCFFFPSSQAISQEAEGLTPEQIRSLRIELAVQRELCRQLLTELSGQTALVSSLNSESESLRKKLEASELRISNIEKALEGSKESEETLQAELDEVKLSLSESKKAMDEWKQSSLEKIGRAERKAKGWRLAFEVATALGIAGWASFLLKK